MIIFAADFDGTLFFHRPIDERTRDLARRFREQGNRFGLNTGRGLYSIEEIEEIGTPFPFDFYITDNGGILADGRKNILYQENLLPETIDRIAESVDPVKLIFSVHGKYLIHPDLTGRWAREFDKWHTVPHSGVASASVECQTHEEALEIAETIEKLHLPVSIHVNRYSVDLTPPGIHKGQRFESLRRCFDEPASIVAIGDSYNDLPAFEKADRAFTFPDSPDELKEKAEVVSDIAEAFERLLEENI